VVGDGSGGGGRVETERERERERGGGREDTKGRERGSRKGAISDHIVCDYLSNDKYINT